MYQVNYNEELTKQHRYYTHFRKLTFWTNCIKYIEVLLQKGVKQHFKMDLKVIWEEGEGHQEA